MPPKKTTTTEPGAAKQAVPDVVNLQITESLGTRTHRFIVNEAVKVGTSDLKDIVEIRQTVGTKDFPQPILTTEEAEVLGHQFWSEWPHKPGHFKTVVNGRRFLVSAKTLETLREKGLVL